MWNFKWVVWKDLNEKEILEQVFEWGESMNQVKPNGESI